MYEALAYFEVVLRNAMDEQLRVWNATQVDANGKQLGPDWCETPAPLLDSIAQTDIDKAWDRACKALDSKHGAGQRTPTHDDVIAQTTLGLWRFLLPSKSASKQVLWSQSLHQAFPHRSRPEHQLVDAVHSVYRLRNRLAHLEPIFHLNLRAAHVNMTNVVSEISPDLRNWYTGLTNGVQAEIAAKPTF